ncbi:PREDICTED: malonyl-CoA-acyl carrier protein transacylase, mitochondrial [Thamnophis sirtalis]|uniref:Malonyl-CoA-acyl carrier protein transacylase, mitochondrial n=1 Tax=Thamnophis sirtalis TaxID=35019 RepID=A0A6I9WXM2_9SAUR|nr:PREDICTED: malonyl-CoA-acyl carrier protein transacylase, mitochondrial [Thamnophis sirtalis]
MRLRGPSMALRLAPRRWLGRQPFPQPPGGEGVADVQELLQNATVEADEQPRKTQRAAPEETSVLLFPGQGSQFVGMGRGLLRYPNVRELFRVAEAVLGYDLWSLCRDGPDARLHRTVHSQPAVFVCSLAAVEKLHHQQPWVRKGLWVGETPEGQERKEVFFCCSRDIFFFSAALYAVKIRAEAMQEASEVIPSGMLSVVGRRDSDYKTACLEAREYCKTVGIEDPVCEVSNYLFPDSRVIAGHLQALEFLQKNSRKFSFARVKMLPVSGAFHTRLMKSATQPLAEALESISFQPPLIPVYSNVDSKKYRQPEQIQRCLVEQLVSPVKWEQIMHTIYERNKGKMFPYTYEVGPGKQLGAILRGCNLKASKYYSNIDVSEDETNEET